MTKILYAAGNRHGSYFLLCRFLQTIKNKNIKLAAYKKSIKNINANFCLDSLLDFKNPSKHINFNNENHKLYVNEIIKFAPDLIISDLDIYTSLIAIDLDIPLYNISPLLLYYAIPNNVKYNLQIYNRFSYLFDKYTITKKYINYIINNANKNYVYSHFCDVENIFELDNRFEWIRPDYFLSESSCFDIDILGFSEQNDFIQNLTTNLYNSIHFCDINKNYINDIGRCKYFLHKAYTSICSDAFYNQKYSLFYPDYKDEECVMNSFVSTYYKLGEIITNDLNINDPQKINIKINDSVKFLGDLL